MITSIGLGKNSFIFAGKDTLAMFTRFGGEPFPVLISDGKHEWREVMTLLAEGENLRLADLTAGLITDCIVDSSGSPAECIPIINDVLAMVRYRSCLRHTASLLLSALEPRMCEDVFSEYHEMLGRAIAGYALRMCFPEKNGRPENLSMNRVVATATGLKAYGMDPETCRACPVDGMFPPCIYAGERIIMDSPATGITVDRDKVTVSSDLSDSESQALFSAGMKLADLLDIAPSRALTEIREYGITEDLGSGQVRMNASFSAWVIDRIKEEAEE